MGCFREEVALETSFERWARSLYSEMGREAMLCLVTDSGKQEDEEKTKTVCFRKL